MQPKFLILKFLDKNLSDLFIKKISEYPRINFIQKNFNGTCNVFIKTDKYFEFILKEHSKNNFYTSYIYLYTCVSIVLSEFIIDNFELKIAHQILGSKYKYLNKHTKNKLKNIIHFVLDSNYPSDTSKNLFLYRKDLILRKLLLNFRTSNYLYVDHFIYFKLTDYYLHLENIISKTYSHC